jgi:hypothetical protein
MPPATAQNRPLYYVERSMRRHLRQTGGQRYEFRPTRVNGVLQWVLRPVWGLAYFIRKFIRRVRAAIDFGIMGYGLRNTDGAVWDVGTLPFTVDLEQLRVYPDD